MTLELSRARPLLVAKFEACFITNHIYYENSKKDPFLLNISDNLQSPRSLLLLLKNFGIKPIKKFSKDTSILLAFWFSAVCNREYMLEISRDAMFLILPVLPQWDLKPCIFHIVMSPPKRWYCDYYQNIRPGVLIKFQNCKQFHPQ